MGLLGVFSFMKISLISPIFYHKKQICFGPPNFIAQLRLWIQMTMRLPPILFGGLKMAKKGFLQHFCCRRDQNSDPKIRFFGLFRAKMTIIGIQNPKLIVTNDYQQFLPHFEWFLAHFQISDAKPELSQFKQKVFF